MPSRSQSVNRIRQNLSFEAEEAQQEVYNLAIDSFLTMPETEQVRFMAGMTVEEVERLLIAARKLRQQAPTHSRKKTQPAAIWRTVDHHEFTGYLITEADNLHRPLAFVDCVDCGDADGFEVAKIVSDCFPRQAWRASCAEEEVSVIDLASFGWPESVQPMPAFIYALRCTPAGPEGKGIDGAPEPREPRPWCRFMADAMTSQLARGA